MLNRPLSRRQFLRLVGLAASAAALRGCAPRQEAISYEPLALEDWAVSDPESQGLDPEAVSDAYRNAAQLANLYSLLVVKNGYLVAERYFNGRDANTASAIASVNKSYVSALAGIALREGALSNLDQRLPEFFPELDWPKMDPRKSQITLRQILQMRSGFPWEEMANVLGRLFSTSNWIQFIEEFSLSADPGAQFGYSNLMAHVMGVIVARAAKTPLLPFARTHLFDPLGARILCWPQDASGYYFGSGDMCVTARDLAKFGLLYLNGGARDGVQIVPRDWVNDSLKSYSSGIYGSGLGRYLRQIEYGYFWWAATAGRHRFNYAWGHGGQLIILLHEMNMVVVTTADSLHGQSGDASWSKERAVIDLATGFIASIRA